MKALTTAERATIRQRISAALANLGAFKAYWLPAKRRFVTRSESVRRAFRVPPGAMELGTYSGEGVTAAEVLRDLDELLASVREPRHAQEPEPEPLEPLTALEWLHQVKPAKGSTIYSSTVFARRRDSLLTGRKPSVKGAPACEAGAQDSIVTQPKPTPAPHPWQAPDAP